MGLSLRQLICSGVAVGAAVGSYFALRGALGQETVSWVCIACAAPVAAAGFFTYDGMTFEQFLCAWWETVFLRAGPRVWKSENQYEQKMTTRKEKKGGWRAAFSISESIGRRKSRALKLSEYDNCRRTRGSRRLPRSVQQSIPIDCIYQDGVWRSGDVYNKAWSVSDVNYAMLSDQSKKEIQTLYGTVYAGLPADCWAQFCVTSQRMDEAAFRRDVLMQVREDNGDIYRAEYNALLENRVRDLGNTRQQKFLIVSTNKPNIQQARERLRHVQGHLVSALSALGCTVREVDNNERLRVLHGFFRAGEEQQFRFDWGKSRRLGHDFKDAICPDSMVFRTDHIEIDRRYAKVLSLMQYPQRLDDSLIPALLRQAPRMALSIHVLPIEPEDAAREIDNARMRVDADKVRFNRKSVDNLDFTSSVPYRTRAQDAVVAEWQDGVSNRDQQMFLTLLTVVCFADSLEELTREVDAIKTQAVNLNCRFIDLKYQQENAFNTTMPYGLRRIENMRTMLTEDVAALVPFHTQEVLDPGGIYYGVNAMSGNLIIGSRALLVNGNGMVIATSGGGKSMFAKAEIRHACQQ